MRRSIPFGFAVAVMLAGLSPLSAVGSPGDAFVATGSLVDGGRDAHCAVRLLDGRVLVMGGEPANHGSPKKASAEVYSPITQTWSLTGAMSTERASHTANLLPDGRVLVAGGGNAAGAIFASTEIWNPATGQFNAAASMNVPRGTHRAVALADGRIFAAGGTSVSDGALALASAEIFHPGTGTWTTTGSMATPRNNHAVVLLADGRVLIAGGSWGRENGYVSMAFCEIYNPVSGTFTPAASMTRARVYAGAVLLTSGRVLVAGGISYAGGPAGTTLNDAEIYDPIANAWATVAGSLTAGGTQMSLTRLADGRVLAAGGANAATSVVTRSADVFDPATSTFSPLPLMGVARTNHSATLLPDGSVLLAGGRTAVTSPYAVASSELFVPYVAPIAPFVLTEPSGIVIQQGQPFTIRWTGGSPSMSIDVLLIDRGPDGTPNAAIEYIGNGVPNTGAFVWTFPASLPFAGPCGRTYHLYIQNTTRTMWTYGPDFIVSCVPPNQPPVASAGPDQAIHAGDVVTLDGTASNDDNTVAASLAYAWTLSSRPAGSAAALVGSATSTPHFTADQTGTYSASLVVTDAAGLSSVADVVSISSNNTRPTANAGADLVTAVDVPATITGTVTDPDGDAMTYEWTITSAPVGSTATLIGATTLSPSLAPDDVGAYVLSLVASDPYDDSVADTMTLTVISGSDYAQAKLLTASAAIAGLSNAAFDATGHRTAMSSLLGNVVKELQKAKTADAVRLLRSLIERADGFALRNAADGNGPGMDWIVTSAGQSAVYAQLTEALAALTP